MNVAEFVTAVQSVGFPIVMVLLMGWYIYKKDKAHAEELAAMRKTIDSNTNVLSKLETLMTSLIERRKDVINDKGRI